MAEDSNGGAVRITNREIYDKLIAVEKKVDRLEDIPKRVRALELKTYTLLAGAITAILAGVAQAVRG